MVGAAGACHHLGHRGPWLDAAPAGRIRKVELATDGSSTVAEPPELIA